MDPFDARLYTDDEEDDGFPLFSEDLVRQLDKDVPHPTWPTTAQGFAGLTTERLMGLAYQAGYRACVERMKAMCREEYDGEARDLRDDAGLGSMGVLGESSDVRQIQLTSHGLDTVPIESLLGDGGDEG